MKENKKPIKKKKFDIGEELRKFLMSSENCIPIEEAIKKAKEKWSEVDKKNKVAKNNK